MKDISDNPMTIKGLILFIAIIFAFTFLGWGIVTISQDMVIDGFEELAVEVNDLKERVTAIEKVVKVKVSALTYNPTIAKCDTTALILGIVKHGTADVKVISMNKNRQLL